MVETVKLDKCSAKEDFQKIRVAKDLCLGNFSVCKKAEDASIGLIHTCNGKTTPGTAPTIAVTVTTDATTSGNRIVDSKTLSKYS